MNLLSSHGVFQTLRVGLTSAFHPLPLFPSVSCPALGLRCRQSKVSLPAVPQPQKGQVAPPEKALVALCCGSWVLSSLPSGPESHRPSQQFRIPCRSALSLPWGPRGAAHTKAEGSPRGRRDLGQSGGRSHQTVTSTRPRDVPQTLFSPSADGAKA